MPGKREIARDVSRRLSDQHSRSKASEGYVVVIHCGHLAEYVSKCFLFAHCCRNLPSRMGFMDERKNVFLRGSTRGVFCGGSLAFKFALHERGARCNRFEADLFRNADQRRKAM